MFCGGSRMCVDLQTNDTCKLFKKGGAKKKTQMLKLSQNIFYRKEIILRNEPLSCKNSVCKQTGNAHMSMVFFLGALIKNNDMKGNCL